MINIASLLGKSTTSKLEKLREAVRQNELDLKQSHAAIDAEKEFTEKLIQLQNQFVENPTPELAKEIATLEAQKVALKQSSASTSQRLHESIYARIALRTAPILRDALQSTRDALERNFPKARSEFVQGLSQYCHNPDLAKAQIAAYEAAHNARMNSTAAKLDAIPNASGDKLHFWSKKFLEQQAA